MGHSNVIIALPLKNIHCSATVDEELLDLIVLVDEELFSLLLLSPVYLRRRQPGNSDHILRKQNFGALRVRREHLPVATRISTHDSVGRNYSAKETSSIAMLSASGAIGSGYSTLGRFDIYSSVHYKQDAPFSTLAAGTGYVITQLN